MTVERNSKGQRLCLDWKKKSIKKRLKVRSTQYRTVHLGYSHATLSAKVKSISVEGWLEGSTGTMRGNCLLTGVPRRSNEGWQASQGWDQRVRSREWRRGSGTSCATMKTWVLVSINHIKCVLGRQADPWSSLSISRTKLRKDCEDPIVASVLYNIPTPHPCTHRHFSMPEKKTENTHIKFSLLCTVPKTLTFHTKLKCIY